jgi:hypothetical protein
MQFCLQTKPFPISKQKKKIVLTKKIEKGRGRRFDPEAKAGPAHYAHPPEAVQNPSP